MDRGDPAGPAAASREGVARRIFEDWLLEACRDVVPSFRRTPLTLRLSFVVDGGCAIEYWPAVRVAVMELVGNAVEHGFHERPLGRIQVRITSGAVGTRIDVRDDGWGLDRATLKEGRGLHRLRSLGEVVLADAAPDTDMVTTATLVIRGTRPSTAECGS